jgi:hypothetical protein
MEAEEIGIMKTTKPIIEVIIISPPDRDILVSELWVRAELLGEVFEEKESLRLTLYPPQTGICWSLDARAVLTGLNDAISELARPKDSG